MADLATVDDLVLRLKLSESTADQNDDLLQALLDDAEALFLSHTGRVACPFSAAISGRVEIHEAPADRLLFVDYPVDAITDIVIGPDIANPTDTLDVTDATQVVWREGSRQIVRMDDFWRLPAPWCAAPSFVQVTYDTQEDLPPDAAAAVLSLAATGWNTSRTASGTIQSEQLDNYQVTYALARDAMTIVAQQSPAWAIAVARHRRFQIA